MTPTFSIDARNLSAKTVDEAIVALEAFRTAAGKGSIQLDLSGLRFVDPYGMVYLCLAARSLSRDFWDIDCVLPESGDVESYLTRMGVFRSVGECVTLPRSTRTGKPAVENESLIEVCDISKREDVASAIELVESRVGAILEKELNYSVREITGFKNVVAELCHNILDHSGDRGVLAAQRYTSKEGRKFAMIAVGDLGMGIRASLAGRYDVSAWSHGHAIGQAVKKAVSRDAARGLGLTVVRSICDDCDGSLHIRSGDSRVYFRGSRSRVYASAGFAGTQLSITLSER